MARQMASTHTGLPFTVTDGGHRYMIGKDACHDSLAWTDLDGDGCIDLVAIATESGKYEDTDHELVAVHVPSGNVGWRALPGEVSKRVSYVDGVIVASTRSAQRLVGLDPRSGKTLWDIELSDQLDEDNFDDDRARAIQPLGGFMCAVQCKDDTFHVVDARTGQLVKSGEGKWKALGGGVPGVVGIEFDGDRLEVWDIPRGKKLADLKDNSQARVVPGPGFFALLRYGEMKGGAWGYEARIFDNATLNELGRATLEHGGGGSKRSSDDDDDDDDDGGSKSINLGEGEFDVIGGCVLAGNRLIWGSRYHDEAYVVDLAPGKTGKTRTFPAPKPGFRFRTLAYVAPALVSVWEKDKGTSKVIAVGHDPNTLGAVWTAEDLGGRSVGKPLHVTSTAVLIPRNPGADSHEYNAQTNPCAIRHLDPASGAVLTEYPVEDVGCIEMNGHFLCAAPTYFSGGLPIVYDTNARTRVL